MKAADDIFLSPLCDSPGLAPESGRNVTSFEPPKSSVGDPRRPTGEIFRSGTRCLKMSDPRAEKDTR